MTRSLNSVVEEIAQNDEMAKEFATMDEIDEIYQYCKDAGLDYSEEEFDEEISSVINSLEYGDDEIPDDELRYIAGGKNGGSDKWVKISKSLGSADSKHEKTAGNLILSAFLEHRKL